jgi:hypothetical protein
MKHTGIRIPGFVIDKKTGKPKRSTRGKSVSQHIAEKKSKRVKVARRVV